MGDIYNHMVAWRGNPKKPNLPFMTCPQVLIISCNYDVMVKSSYFHRYAGAVSKAGVSLEAGAWGLEFPPSM